MTDLTEAARATRMHTIYEAWPRDFRVSGDSAMRVFANAAEAQAACDRLNLLAVLEAIREPSERMVKAAPASDLKTKFGALYVWRAMIDALIAEVKG